MSIVIPTHNRKQMLNSVLSAFEKQTYDRDMEYVVVMDGCVDGTREMLAELQLQHPLRTVELTGLGAAAARNRGAFAATGEYVLFIDDDIIPSPTMVARHMEWHERYPDSAVIGACPFGMGVKISRIGQFGRDWWHSQYSLMAAKDHQSTFRDFLTGNASIPRRIFVEMGGFDESFRHAGREDYELGLRLMKAGVAIRFNPEAYGYHYPSDGYLRAMKRSWVHGKADVILARKHPLTMQFTALGSFRQKGSKARSYAIWVAFNAPWVGDAFAWLASRWLNIVRPVIPQERWLQFSGMLMGYYYWRGVKNQGWSGIEQERLAKDTWITNPASGRIKFVCQTLDNGLKEINELENCSSVLVLISVHRQSLGWIIVRPQGGKSCITPEELATAAMEQLGRQFSKHSITWDSLVKTISSELALENSDEAEEVDSLSILTEEPHQHDEFWASEVKRTFSDPEVAAAIGPVVPTGVDTRADELLWEMSGVEKWLYVPPFIINKNLSSVRAALEVDSVSHWIAVRKDILDKITPDKADRYLPLILQRLMANEYTIVYHPGAVMWRNNMAGRDNFHNVLASSRIRLGRFAWSVLSKERGSKLNAFAAISRWIRWRGKRGLKRLLGRGIYPATACSSEIFYFMIGMAGGVLGRPYGGK